MQGDWTCPACGDLQFARNASCRNCSTPNPSGGGTQPGVKYSNDANIYVYGFSPQWGDNELQELFSKFGTILSTKISRHETGASKGFGFVAFDDGVSAKLACDTLNGQDGGDGKLLQVRLKASKAGGMDPQQIAAQGGRQGDWMCPGCSDHQFARNAQCRKCGTPRPDQANMGVMGGGCAGGNGMMGAGTGMMGGGCAGGKGMQGFQQQAYQQQGFQQPAAGFQQPAAGFQQQQQQQQPAANQSQPEEQLPDGWAAFFTPDGRRCYMHLATASTTYESPCQPQEESLPEGWMEFVTPDGKTCYTHIYTKATTWERPTNPVTSDAGQMAALQAQLQAQAGMAQHGMGAQDGMAQAGMAAAGMVPGDWDCPQCGDHQFARNAKCRKCGTANPSGGGTVSGAMYERQANVYVYGIPPEWGNDEMTALFARCGNVVSVKIGMHDDGRSKGYGFVAFDAAEGATLAVQSFDGFDIGDGKRIQVRIKGEKGGGKGNSQMPGDWICPACGDRQFARNVSCRQCGTGKPQDARVSPY